MHVGRCCCAICCRCIALWHGNILNMLWFVNLWRLYASWITSATSRWQPKGFWHYCWHGNWKCKKNGWANGWPDIYFLWWESVLRSLLIWCWSSGIMSFILVSMMFSALFSLDICHHSSIHIHIWQSVNFGTFITAFLFFILSGGAAFLSSPVWLS